MPKSNGLTGSQITRVWTRTTEPQPCLSASMNRSDILHYYGVMISLRECLIGMVIVLVRETPNPRTNLLMHISTISATQKHFKTLPFIQLSVNTHVTLEIGSCACLPLHPTAALPRVRILRTVHSLRQQWDSFVPVRRMRTPLTLAAILDRTALCPRYAPVSCPKLNQFQLVKQQIHVLSLHLCSAAVLMAAANLHRLRQPPRRLVSRSSQTLPML